MAHRMHVLIDAYGGTEGVQMVARLILVTPWPLGLRDAPAWFAYAPGSYRTDVPWVGFSP